MQEHIVELLRKASSGLKERYPLSSMAIFGSSTRLDFDENSDVDILIDFNSDDFLLFNSLAEELESLVGRKVAIVTKRSLKARHFNYLKDRLLYV